MRLGVCIFTGVVAFAPSLVALLLQLNRLTGIQVLEWVVPCALWGLAWTRGPQRALLLPLPIALFLACIVLVPVPDGFTWPRLAGVALALAVTAAAVTGIRATIAWSALAVI
ncbi:MAG: hypothetical protein ACKOT0_04390, partial [bacterium]